MESKTTVINKTMHIGLDMNTDKLQLKLRAISKHLDALADELDSIDNETCNKCGSPDLHEENFYAGDRVVHRTITCNSCGYEESESFE